MAKADYSKLKNVFDDKKRTPITPANMYETNHSEKTESKKARNQENKKSEYIKFAGLIREDLKKSLQIFCVQNNLKEYKALEQAVEMFLENHKVKA